MPQPYRSATTISGRNMAGARALWRATGVKDEDFGKPIIAIANSFTQFVPGHVHLKDLGQLVAQSVAEAGGIGREFSTIAIDDGIAMGHGGMVNMLTKSGTNQLHGSAFEYLRNSAAGCQELFRSEEALVQAKPVWRISGRTHPERQDFFLWKL